METETPLMLLFVCNGTDQGSILSDTKQMLDSAYKDIPHFTLQLNVPCLPAKTKQNNNKGYDQYKEQGKKAFHFEVAKEDINYFKFLSSHAH
jgi:hypothetical protein